MIFYTGEHEEKLMPYENEYGQVKYQVVTRSKRLGTLIPLHQLLNKYILKRYPNGHIEL